ncbi:hypothetical protein V8E36_007511 [Tilletia maclaganii]
MSRNHNVGFSSASPISTRTARDADRIRPADASPSSLLYFGPGMSAGLLKPRQRRPHRRNTASSSAATSTSALSSTSASSSTALRALAAASASARAATTGPSALRPHGAASQPLLPASGPSSDRAHTAATSSLPTPTALATRPTPSAPTFTASLMLDILKDGPQLPAPTPARTPQRLAELGRDSIGTNRKAITTQGAVSSPALSAKRAELRKQLEERERLKRVQKGGKAEAGADATAKGGEAAANGKLPASTAEPATKKRMTVLDMIERTAGSGGGLPPRPRPTPSSSSVTNPKQAGTSNAPPTLLPAPSTQSAQTASSAPSIAPNLQIRPSGFQTSSSTPKPVPPTSLPSPTTPATAFGSAPAKIAGPSPSSSPSAPTIDFGLDAVVQTLLKTSSTRGSSEPGTEKARQDALLVDRAKLPAFTFNL